MADNAQSMPASESSMQGMMLRLFLSALVILFAAITGMVARRIYVDHAAASGFASFYVGGRLVTVERAMIRNPDLRDGGAVNRLDLAVKWPDFRATGNAIGQPGQDIVLVAVEDAASRIKSPDDIDPAERPAALYARFLKEEATTTESGLVLRQFKPGSPYDGEDLYVSTPDEHVFAARCPRAVPKSGLAENCLWQTRLNGLEVHTRFAPKLLDHWQGLVTGVRTLVPRIAAVPKK